MEKQRWEESEKRREKERRSEKRKSQRKEGAGARKGRKANGCGSGGSRSRLAKAAGAEPSGQIRYEKLHAIVARNTCRSQNVQNALCSDHFWKLRCRKRVWRKAHFEVKIYKTHQVRTTFGSWDVENVCGAKHISKSKSTTHTRFGALLEVEMSKKCTALSKCTKHLMFGPLLEVEMPKTCTALWREEHYEVKIAQNTPGSEHFFEVEMSKKRTPLWHETDFEVNMYKAPCVRTTFGSWDVENVHGIVVRSTFQSQNLQHTPGSEHFWKLKCWNISRRWSGSTCPSQNVKNTVTCSDHSWRFRCGFAW